MTIRLEDIPNSLLIRQVVYLSDRKGLKPRNEMDLFVLKKITEGQYRRESLVFHVYETKCEKNFELTIDRIFSKSISLR